MIKEFHAIAKRIQISPVSLRNEFSLSFCHFHWDTLSILRYVTIFKMNFDLQLLKVFLLFLHNPGQYLQTKL